MDHTHAQGRLQSASGLACHVSTLTHGLSGPQHQGSGERYQEITAEGGAEDEFMMWARLEARMGQKPPDSQVPGYHSRVCTSHPP
jgi:hypothetical protein